MSFAVQVTCACGARARLARTVQGPVSFPFVCHSCEGLIQVTVSQRDWQKAAHMNSIMVGDELVRH